METAERIAHMTGFFRSLTRTEQDEWLQSMGLMRMMDDKSATPGQSDTLTLTPTREQLQQRRSEQQKLLKGSGSPRGIGAGAGSRGREALRLMEDNDPQIDPLPLLNVSGVRLTEAEVRNWFDELDTNKNGWLSKDEFKQMYLELDTFGTPVRESWIDERLQKMKAFDDGRLSFDEFAYLVSHLASR